MRIRKAASLIRCFLSGSFPRLNVPQGPGFAFQTQVGVRVQESGARVSFHEQVNMFLGLIKAGGTRLLQRLLNLLSNVVVDVDLGRKGREMYIARDSVAFMLNMLFSLLF